MTFFPVYISVFDIRSRDHPHSWLTLSDKPVLSNFLIAIHEIDRKPVPFTGLIKFSAEEIFDFLEDFVWVVVATPKRQKARGPIQFSRRRRSAVVYHVRGDDHSSVVLERETHAAGGNQGRRHRGFDPKDTVRLRLDGTSVVADFGVMTVSIPLAQITNSPIDISGDHKIPPTRDRRHQLRLFRSGPVLYLESESSSFTTGTTVYITGGGHIGRSAYGFASPTFR